MDPASAALVAEAARKSSVLWLDGHPLWHVWQDGAAHVIGDGDEQPLPAVTDTATVAIRSKDKGGRLVTFAARVTAVSPGTPAWDAVIPELSARRLNGTADQAERWARSCHLLRLEPVGDLDDVPPVSHAAPPAPTPATTRGPLPFLFGRRRATGA